ncbi:RNA polymerase sigma factor [Chitinophaga rhizophila]|uniref:RNA polymerase sigma factor n=1 Tax=Chitinophaga rhizophila TaxID=2866212 RepID=A0ABS7GCG8_9BACT|nr:RNA polymerase sigma factor [Chitinophaga rhizophila]MBW8684845.1 RNA polymerase sigma factor [Chitinophaga rhizophila]
MQASANNLNNTTITDHLVSRCKKGDTLAFRELYNAYSGAMYNICLRMTGNPADAEDTLQEAFMQVFKNLERLENAGSVTAWIKRIVVNHCLSHLRRKKVYFEEVDNIDVEEETIVDEGDFAWTVAAIKDAIHVLPNGYRTVLNLYLFEEYSHKEIASMLDISESTVKTQYMRAKDKVRQIIQQKKMIR